MVVDLNRVVEKQRIGITFRTLKNYSVSKLSDSLESLNLESEAPIIGATKRRAIEHFDLIKEENEYHISSMVTSPFKIKYPTIEAGVLKIKDRVEYNARYVEAIIRMQNNLMILFSQSQPEIIKFSKYIKEITLKGFNPTPLKFNKKIMKEILNHFIKINKLKILKNSGEGIKSIRFNGEDLLEDKYVSNILENEEFEIKEIGGEIPLSDNNLINFYVNYRGRIVAKGGKEILVLDNIYPIIKEIEKIYIKKKE